MLCHNPVPTLNAYGDQFAANGYRLAPGEVSLDTLATGDPLLTLTEDLGLAFRLDAYVRGYADGDVSTDFETPVGPEAAASAPISKTISYYFYTFLSSGARSGASRTR